MSAAKSPSHVCVAFSSCRAIFLVVHRIVFCRHRLWSARCISFLWFFYKSRREVHIWDKICRWKAAPSACRTKMLFICIMLSRLPTETLKHMFTFHDDPSRVALRHTCAACAKRSTNDARLKISDFLVTAKMFCFAVSIGCPLTAKTFEMAAKYSSMSVLKTLRRLGCVRSYKVSRRLAMRENIRVLRFMLRNNF